MKRNTCLTVAIISMVLIICILIFTVSNRIRLEDISDFNEHLSPLLDIVNRKPAPDLVVAGYFDYQDDPAFGNENSDVAVVLFTDYQCPYCIELQQRIVPEILRLYGSKVKLVIKNLPLVDLHDKAYLAAELSEWAYAEGVFDSFYKAVSVDNQAFLDEGYMDWAISNQLDLNDFNKIRMRKNIEKKIEKDLADAEAAGITATPSLVIGGRILPGLPSVGELSAILADNILSSGFTVSPRRLVERIGEYKIIDLRNESDFESGHIPGAVNNPWSSDIDFEKLMAESLDRGVVFYCSRGITSMKAAKICRSLGFDDSFSLSEGFFSWNAQGMQTAVGR